MSENAGDAVVASAQPDEDSLLLLQHRDGISTAFPDLVGRYRRRVYSYLIRAGVDAAARDDLFQEIFLRIHHAVWSFNAQAAARPWIFTIVANTVRSHMRSTQVRSVVELAAEPMKDREPAGDSGQLSEARETAAWLQESILLLPPPQREVVNLCCVEQLPQEEAAEILGLPVNTLKTHLRRARLTLAQAWARRDARGRREVTS